MSRTVDICKRALAALHAGGMPQLLGERIDRLTGKDGVVIRMLPPHTVATYFDGTRRMDYTLQVIAKSLDPLEAMSLCEQACEILRTADLSSANGTYELAASAEPVSDIEEITIGADRRHVFCVRLTAQIIRF